MKTEQKIKTLTSLNKTSKAGTSSIAQTKKKVQQKSLEQQVYEQPIKNIQAERLNRVFDKICGNPYKGSKRQKQESRDTQQLRDKFDKKDIIRILTELGFHYSKPEVDQWIWEVDQDLDGYVNRYQFTLMYKRCIFDKNGLQPRNLFNLVQFLMYDQTQRGRITVEDTLELIYVRYYLKDEQSHIQAIFGDNQKTADGLERQVTFEQYLKKIRQNDLKRRKKLEEQRKTVQSIIKKKQ